MEQNFLYGAAYYEEYLPCDRLEEDMRLMAAAGFNTVRIAESTWSVEEPRPGEYDFSHVDRVIDAAQRHGLSVIVGTPTYAVPVWLAQLDPAVLAVTKDGPGRYGPRQIMDITNPTYLRYAEGIIRALVSHTAGRKNVIGFQLDNETKHYGTAGPAVIDRFCQWMKDRFGTVEAMNAALGLNYWSNSVASFEELPDPAGTVNGSYACEFAAFQRELAADFLRWQAGIVGEYKRPDQFITQNFDFDWRSVVPSGHQGGYSHGVQPDMDHWDGSRAVTLVGTDVYCPGQDGLTGMEIAFAGDEMRSLKKAPYLVLETQAQGIPQMTPYPGQLRLMVWSHVASGARGMMYWPWSSIHNSLESWFKGILGHDFVPGPVYREAAAVGQELKRLAPRLGGIQKRNRIAMMVSPYALHALRAFPTDNDLCYNDVVLWMYRALYELNLECDILYPQQEDWSGYDLLVFPQLYTVDQAMTERVRAFVERGGTVFATFRSFVADEHVKIRHDPLPHGLTDVFGMTYSQNTRPAGVTVDGTPAAHWMELLTPASAETAARYEHRHWGEYAAVTRNAFGRGHAWYLGSMVPAETLKAYLLRAAGDAGIEAPDLRFPLVLRSGTDRAGEPVRFLFNYSDEPQKLSVSWAGTDLLTGRSFQPGEEFSLPGWGVCILGTPAGKTDA